MTGRGPFGLYRVVVERTQERVLIVRATSRDEAEDAAVHYSFDEHTGWEDVDTRVAVQTRLLNDGETA